MPSLSVVKHESPFASLDSGFPSHAPLRRILSPEPYEDRGRRGIPPHRLESPEPGAEPECESSPVLSQTPVPPDLHLHHLYLYPKPLAADGIVLFENSLQPVWVLATFAALGFPVSHADLVAFHLIAKSAHRLLWPMVAHPNSLLIAAPAQLEFLFPTLLEVGAAVPAQSPLTCEAPQTELQS